MNPLVSVIVPTKNSEKFIGRCLKSIKSQTYKNLEIIVVDNNSTDRTKEIAGKYTDKVFDKGPERSAQRNFGVEKSAGKYVLIIDSDMLLSEKVVEACVEKIGSDEKIKGLVTPEESFGKGFWAKCKKLERSFYVGVDWMEAARFFPKDVYLKTGGYDENMVSGEDWDLSQRTEDFGKIERINNFIYHNEGRISLVKTIKKKFYYAGKFSKYTKKNSNWEKIVRQTSFTRRYKLFLSQPKKLFKNPVIGLGVLFMKTCEFGFGGLGYLSKEKEYEFKNNENFAKITKWPEISFIIPTYNAEKYLNKCLRSIEKQDYSKEKVEILIIDGGSTDKTAEIARKFNTKILINEKRIAEYGKTIGIKESKGEYFVLLDSDNEIVEHDWLKGMVGPIIRHPELFGVESPFSHDKSLSSLNRYFARMRIADPLAKCLASSPKKITEYTRCKILNFSPNAILITGANGFLWNKSLVMKFKEWEEKFEEANSSTFLHEITGTDYAIPKGISVKHHYCDGILDYIKKRKKIALKIKQRIKNKEYIWVKKNSYFEIIFFVIYLGTFIGPTIEACYKNIKHKTLDYSWHPVVGFLTVWVYGINFISKN